MGLSNWFIQLVYPMGLSYAFYQQVYPMHFINGFIQWVYPTGLAEKVIQWVYPMGLAEKVINGLLVRTKLYNLCCPASRCPPRASPCPRHPNPNPGNPTVPLIRTFNPDSCQRFLQLLSQWFQIYVGYRYREMSGALLYGWGNDIRFFQMFFFI